MGRAVLQANINVSKNDNHSMLRRIRFVCLEGRRQTWWWRSHRVQIRHGILSWVKELIPRVIKAMAGLAIEDHVCIP